jgi:arylsulfatase A-like enzyme
MLYDLFPTIAGLTGSAIPPGVEGLDLSGLWRGETQQVREAIYTAYEDKMRAVRDGRYKLILYPPLGHAQLFDLEHDPFELQNLAGNAAYAEVEARLTALLESEHARLEDPHPLVPDEKASMEFDHGSVDRQPDRHQPEWVVKKYFRQ